MASCDICGKEANLVRAVIEGTELNVCNSCSSFGKILSQSETFIEPKKSITQSKPLVEEIEIIVSDYSNKIKSAREKMDFTQKEFAQKLFERESIIRKIESRSIEPTFSLAKKIERLCNIKLIEKEIINSKEKPINFKDEGLTIGDLLKKKNE